MLWRTGGGSTVSGTSNFFDLSESVFEEWDDDRVSTLTQNDHKL